MIITKPQALSSALRPVVPSQARAIYPTPVVETAIVATPTGYRIAKRSFDFIVALVFLILLTPLMILIALAIRLDDGGPAIIVQRRVGVGGRVYKFYKFRSMRLGIDYSHAHREFAQKVIRGEITTGPKSNGGLLKPTGDHRIITRVGRILRKTSLDELPQLFNVLIGNMSLVGPRPSMDYEVEAYFDHYLPRLSVLPGITGLAQINGRSNVPFPQIVELDLQYIEQRSFWLDLRILLETPSVIFSMRGVG